MQQGGFGGSPPGGQPPGGAHPYGAPQHPGQFPGQHPGQFPGQAQAATPGPYPGAQAQPPPQGQYPSQGQFPGQHAAAPGAWPGQPGVGQFPNAPGMAAQHYAGAGMPNAAQMQAAQMQAAQMQAVHMQAAQMQAAQMQAAQMQAAFGGGAAPRPAFGHAQQALASAGTSMKIMKYAFLTVGILGVLAGVGMIFMVDLVTGVIVAGSSLVFVFVPLLILPKFGGMLNHATAMVDGFAAKERLAQTGVPAQGRLVTVQQTGRMINMNPEIQAVVEVHHPQFGVYQTQTTAIVPQIAIPRAQPGSAVQIRVDPQNQQEIALVF
jgi:hypothetical protein